MAAVSGSSARASGSRCTFPRIADFLPGPFSHAPEIVRFFSELVAPFPYEKLAHLAELDALWRHGERGRDLLRRRAVPPSHHAAWRHRARNGAPVVRRCRHRARMVARVALGRIRDVFPAVVGRALSRRQRVSRGHAADPGSDRRRLPKCLASGDRYAADQPHGAAQHEQLPEGRLDAAHASRRSSATRRSFAGFARTISRTAIRRRSRTISVARSRRTPGDR